MVVPASVPKWFASQYPSLQLAPQWLEECHTFLQENFPELTAPILLKKIENQLLLSDLATSTTHHAGLFPACDDEWTGVLFSDAKGAGVLVQVLEILEIGRPALELLKLHRDKVEDRKVFKEHGRTVQRAAVIADDPTQNATGNNDIAEEAPNNSKGFPRAMLRLRVSDGFNEYVAIETKRIHGLSLDDTPLGCKIMLKKVRCQRGVLMLDETCCTVKGGSIPDLENDRDALLEAWLEARIRGEDDLTTRPLQRHGSQGGGRSSTVSASTAGRNSRQPATGPPQSRAPVTINTSTRPAASTSAASTSNASRNAPVNRTTAPKPTQRAQIRAAEEDDFDDFDDDMFDDDEEALAALQEAELTASNTRAQASRSTTSNSTNSRQSSIISAGSSRTATSVNERRPTSNRAPAAGPARQAQPAQVIDIDDSTDDEDAAVALMLLSDTSQAGNDRAENTGARNASRGRTNQPIELD